MEPINLGQTVTGNMGSVGQTPTPVALMQPQTQSQPQQITAPIGSQQSVTSPPPLDPSTLDPAVVKVLHTIRQVESQGNYNAVGDNGASMGAFQWNNGGTPVPQGQTPKNWQTAAQQYLGSASAPMTPANQNYVAYHQILDYKNKGLTPNSIDALWNGARPDPNNPGQFVHINSTRATQFQNVLASQANGTPTPTPTPDPMANPSLLGFGENLIKSGANFVGNLGSALIHPLSTVQGLASIPVGVLQELGGQTTPETQTFDNFTNYFKQRYGGVANIEKALYTDPVGVAGDLAAAFGVGGGLAGIASKGADLAGLGDMATVAKEGAAATEGSGIAGGLQKVASGLNKASTATNPLTPVIAGGMKLVGTAEGPLLEVGAQGLGQNPGAISDMLKNPQDYTEAQIANLTRGTVTQEVKSALDAKDAEITQTLAQQGESGSQYNQFRDNPTPINLPPDWLDNQLRTVGKLDVTDGVISKTSTSLTRSNADVSKLQAIYNSYKSDFLNGKMTSEKLLNLRQDLDEKINYNNPEGATSKFETIAKAIRTNLNKEARPQVAGLEAKDAEFSDFAKQAEAQKEEYDFLRKGILDKGGNLMDGAIAKIANAAKSTKELASDPFLQRLEQISPGITRRIQIMKVVEDWNAGGTKVGSYSRSLSQTARVGSIVFGAATGNIHLLAGAIAMDVIADPARSMALLRTMSKLRPEVIKPTLAKLAQFATTGSVLSNINKTPIEAQTVQPQGGVQPQNPQDLGQMNPSSTPLPQSSQGITQPQVNSSQNNITQSPEYQAAISAGYSPEEIQYYLKKEGLVQ